MAVFVGTNDIFCQCRGFFEAKKKSGRFARPCQKARHTLCGYRSWSVLEEITGKAAAVAIEVDGRFVSVQDTRACHMMASACHLALNAYMSTQAAGLGVGATTL